MARKRAEYNTAMRDLSGHNALITGAGRRLGRAFAEAIGERGGGVVVHYRSSAEEAAQVAESIERAGGRAITLQADLANLDGLGPLVEQATAQLGPIDYLVNNASIFAPGSALEASLEGWQKHLDVNLSAPFILSQHFARALGERSGAIVNLLDWRALRPGSDHFPYTISKAGLASLTRALAAALAPTIRVNGLALGAILPPEGGAEGDPIAGVPLQRWGKVEEVVDGLLFLLAGPGAITGEILLLDGGRHLSPSDV